MRRQVLLFVIIAFALSITFTAPQSATIQAQDGPEEYVVATHYPEFGGVEPAPREVFDAAYTEYNNATNDYYAVDEATFEAIIGLVEEATGLEVLVHNDWANVVEDSEALQIVNNVPIENALYTIILPPGWNKDAEMPVILSGNGAGTSNNARFYGGETIAAELVAASAVGRLGGIIMVLSNAGGTESQGVDEGTYRSVGAFFDFIHENGGDKYNVMTAGGSRGGGSALMWAINPLELDYEVHTVFAAVPPTFYGQLSQVSVLTFPAMASIGITISHDPEAWRYDDEGPRPGMDPSPYNEILLGTGDPEQADSLSPIGMAEGLLGKQVFLSAGTHDPFFDLSFYLAFDRRLTELGVEHGTVVTLGLGHEASPFWMEVLGLQLLRMTNGIPTDVPEGRFYTVNLAPPDVEEVSLEEYFAARDIEADPEELPVTMQLPWKAGVGNPIDVTVCGTPGDEVALIASSEEGDVLYELDTTLDESECHREQVTVEVPPGNYLWALTVNGKVIRPTNTPTVMGEDGCGLPAVTSVTEEQPTPTESRFFRQGFGLIEYPVQPESCLNGE